MRARECGVANYLTVSTLAGYSLNATWQDLVDRMGGEKVRNYFQTCILKKKKKEYFIRNHPNCYKYVCTDCRPSQSCVQKSNTRY